MFIVDELFKQDDGVLVIPTFVDPPPKVGGKEMSSETYLSRLYSLLSIASLSGCCQVNYWLPSLSLSGYGFLLIFDIHAVTCDLLCSNQLLPVPCLLLISGYSTPWTL